MKIISAFVIFIIVGCEPAAPSLDFLLNLLKKDDLHDFYAAASNREISELRKFFEAHADNKIFNYGALLNANIITPENKKLFKPDLTQLDYLAGVPNPENRTCWFGSAVMAMAAGELFDDFLEIDKQVGDKWKARPQIIQKDADHLLRILRTLVYELRLGPKASEQRLMRLTKDMQQSIILLSNENKRAVFFRELRENYDFYDKIIIRKNRLNNKELDIRKLKISAAEKDRITKLPVPDFFGFYEPLQCLVNKEKGADANLLLRTLFIMLDPFGKTAQYLTLYDFKDSLRGEGNTHDIILTEPITVEASGPRTKLIIYSSPHADITLSNTDDVEISPLLELSDRGAILPSWALSANSNNTGLDYNVELIAKNLHSDRHEITVIFNPKIKKWEIHDDARKATFSDRPDISLYMDDLLYFARKN